MEEHFIQFILVLVQTYQELRPSRHHHWTLLDITGHYWTLLDIIGHYWILLDIIGHYWTLLEIIEH